MTTDYYTMLSILRSSVTKELADSARAIFDKHDIPEAYQNTPDIELANMMRTVLASTPQATVPPERPRVQETVKRDRTIEPPPSDYDPDHVLVNLIELARSDLSEFGDEVHTLAASFLRLNIWLQGGGYLPMAWRVWSDMVCTVRHGADEESGTPAIDGMSEVPSVVQLRNPDTGEMEPVMAMHMVPIPAQERLNNIRALERTLREGYEGANNAFAGGVMHVLRDLRPLLYPNFFDNDEDSDGG